MGLAEFWMWIEALNVAVLKTKRIRDYDFLHAWWKELTGYQDSHS